MKCTKCNCECDEVYCGLIKDTFLCENCWEQERETPLDNTKNNIINLLLDIFRHIIKR